MSATPTPGAPIGASVPQESAARHLWRTALNSGTYFASDAVARAVSLGLVLAYTRVFRPQDYGTLALATTITALLAPVIGLSVTASITRLYFEARDERDRARLYGSTLAFLLVVPAIGLLILEVLGDLGYLDMFAAAPWSPYLRLACWTAYALLFADIPVAIAISERRSRLVLVLGIVNALLLLGASLFFVVLLDEGVVGVLRGALLAAVVMALISIVLTWRAAGNRLGWSRVWLLQALGFGIPLVPHSIAQWLLQVSDRLLLTHYVAPDAVGVYYIGYSVAAVAGLGALGVAKAIGPVVTADLKAGSDVRVIRLGTYAFAVLTWFCLLLASVGATVLAFLVPSKFDGAIAIVPVVSLAYVAFGAYTIVAQGIWFSMRTWLVPLVTLAAAAVNIGLNLIFIPRFGIIGAAWDTVAGFGVLAVLQGFWAFRLHPIRWDYVRCLLALVAALVTYFMCSRIWLGASERGLVLELFGAFAVFPVLLALSGFVTPRELGWLRAHAPDALRPMLAVVRSRPGRDEVDEVSAPVDAGGALPLRRRLAIVLPIAAFVAATTHWMNWQTPIRIGFAADVDNYERIARAAPHFTWPQITGHISMWPIHYLIGLISKATHVPLHATYYVAAIIVLSAVVITVDHILVRLAVGLPAYVVAMSVLLLDPYVFRFLALAPGMINDGTFLLGVSIALYALLERRLGVVCVGLTLAGLARGLSVPPVLLAVLVWLLVIDPDQRVATRRRILQAIGVVAVPAAAVAVAYAIGRSTPGHALPVADCCALADTTIWGDIRDLPSSGARLALHAFRIVLGLAMVSAMLAAGLALRARSNRRTSLSLSRAFWGALLMASLMVAQPLLVASKSNAGAEPRLSSLAIVPGVVAVALLVEALQRAGIASLTRPVLLGLVGIFAVASLNHRFASISPSTSAQFAALELLCMVAVVLLLASVTSAGGWRGNTKPRDDGSGVPRREM